MPGEYLIEARNKAVETYNEGLDYEQKGDWENALVCYRQAMECKDVYDAALYKTGRCYAALENWDKAESVFLQILAKDSGNLTVKHSLAYIHIQKGEIQAGLEEYKTLHQDNLHDKLIAKSYIKVLLLADQKDEAALEFDIFKETFSDSEDIAELEKLFE